MLIGVKIQDEILDLETLKERSLESDAGEKIFYDNSDDALKIIRHSCAHLMAQAILELYPEAQFFVGPVVDEGFYYDFKVNSKITPESLEQIEQKMKEISKRNAKIIKSTLPREEAKVRFENDTLKQAVISRLHDANLSIYTQDNFYDLCRGPHVPSTGLLAHFKLTKLAGAYLGGDESKEMLTRIYGIAFATKDALQNYLKVLEEAIKRDHRKIGSALKIFAFDEEIGAGLPIWLPRGARMRRRLEEILSRALMQEGYEPVRGPEILKSDLWKKSGHYDNYKENMYFTAIDEMEYGIKPMNCIGHIKVYQSEMRSYKDLPLRFYEYGLVHRHEKSGVLHGLLRMREFTIDDAHIFCTPSQIQNEISKVIKFAHKTLEMFGFNYEMELSTRPEKSIGDDEIWESTTASLINALKEAQIDYKVDEGGGAFYGPKIDIKITDAIGRKWQCGTVQLDMNLPERFELEYVNQDGQKARPVMIHRAIFGSFERFIAILIEHFKGELPFFLSPMQVVLIPISQEDKSYAEELKAKLSKINIFSEILDRNESLNKKVRNAEKDKAALIVVIGKEERESRVLSLRDRYKMYSDGQIKLKEEEFLNLLKKSMEEVSF